MIKIYLIYFFGRFCELLGCNQLASGAYSKVIKHRVFFLDAHERFRYVFKKLNNILPLVAYGGVGDLLQCLPFMLSHPNLKYIVASHFSHINSLLKSINIKTHKVLLYNDLYQYKKIRDSIIKPDKHFVCPRSLFFIKSPFLSRGRLFDSKRKTVGIHISSSLFAPEKALPKNFSKLLIRKLVLNGFNVIFFLTNEEFKKVSVVHHRYVKYAHDINIVKNLSLVEQCDFFVGSDSAFKTMSAMLKIPTIVLMANDKNSFRDRVFINPYIKEGVMSVYKYVAMNDKTINRAIDFVINKLN